MWQITTSYWISSLRITITSITLFTFIHLIQNIKQSTPSISSLTQSSLPISSLIKISSKDLNQYHDEHNYQAQSTSNTKLSNCIKLHQYQVLYQLEVLFQLWGLGEQSGFKLSFSSFSLLVVVDLPDGSVGDSSPPCPSSSPPRWPWWPETRQSQQISGRKELIRNTCCHCTVESLMMEWWKVLWCPIYVEC